MASRRATGIVAITSTGIVVALTAELLSSAGAFSATAVRVLWAAALLATLPAALHVWRRRGRMTRLCGADRITAGAIGASLVATLVAGLASAPNNWDSMTYHLPRALHWLENGSLAHYETAIERQLYQPPFAEIMLAHAVGLAGSDVLVSLVQWAAFAGCIWLVAVLAGELGADRGRRLLAAAIFAAAPMAVLQAASTQNDLVVSVFVLVVAVTAASRRLDARVRGVVGGAAAGLAVLTKGTAWVIVPPFALVLLLDLCRRRGARGAAFVAAGLALGAVVNAGHAWRNAQSFGGPLGAPTAELANAHPGPAATLSNLTRNIALELPLPQVEAAVRGIHDAAGLDVESPDTTYADARFSIYRGRPSEDHTGNPLQLTLAILALASLGWRRDRRLVVYLLTLAASVTLFAAVLRWQPWNSRLMLPLVALAAPWTAAALPALVVRRRVALAVVLGASALLVAATSASRPLVGGDNVFATGRTAEMFRARSPEYRAGYEAAVRALAACDAVELDLRSGNAWEYPAWALLRAGPFGNVRLAREPEACRLRVGDEEVVAEVGGAPPGRAEASPAAAARTR